MRLSLLLLATAPRFERAEDWLGGGTFIRAPFSEGMRFVYLWAVVIRAVSVPGIVMMGIFLVVLMFGEFYAWRKGDLRWH